MSSEEKPAINVVLLWHMHQPEYRNLATNEYRLPWTYLHAIKDYVDMAEHIRAIPNARAVVNFAPILLEQISDYAKQIEVYLETGTPTSDPLLNSLTSDERFFSNSEERLTLIQTCLKANEDRLIKRYSAYEHLTQIARQLSTPDSVDYLYRQFFVDLVVWYHLAWLGETVKRNSPLVKKLIQQKRDYTLEDRRALLSLIGDLIGSIIPSYKTLVNSGKVELSMSPYAHPMLPLLLDFNTLREAMPDAPLPEMATYPKGEERTQWHIQHGIDVFERHFGIKPAGIWPSEGGISTDVARLLDKSGFKWMASGDTVLHNSLNQYAEVNTQDECRHQACKLPEHEIRMFFRDDGLSDQIGFNFATWHAVDAVSDLQHHLHNIRNYCPNPDQSVVSIILDGENAWEHYPENGYHFLSELYTRLAEDPAINLTTYSTFLEQTEHARSINGLVAGSWVYGTFSTWMGDPDKNRAWDILCKAKQAVDEWLAASPAHRMSPELINQLAVCEGSDWFWWFGDYNPSDSVKDFDELYRLNVKNLYRLINQPIPKALDIPLSQGSHSPEAEAGGVMRRGS